MPNYSQYSFFVGILILLLDAYADDPPQNFTPKCKSFCDNKPLGWEGEYVLDCERHYSDPNDTNKCASECDSCPSVCDSSDRRKKFICPKTELGSNGCSSRCNKHRNGNLNGYILKCDEVNTFPREIEACQQSCKECPVWVCNVNIGNNMFFCPSVRYDKECKQSCDYFRFLLDKSSEFQFKCDDLPSLKDRTKCDEDCARCIFPVCTSKKYGKEWSCPPPSGPKPISGTGKTGLTYKGQCEKRCDKLLGGTDRYEFVCEGLFKSGPDLKACKRDCKSCPTEVCAYSGIGNRFNCPASSNHMDEEDQIKRISIGIVAAAVIAVVMTILFLIALFCYCKNRRPRVSEGMQYQKKVSQHSLPPLQPIGTDQLGLSFIDSLLPEMQVSESALLVKLPRAESSADM